MKYRKILTRVKKSKKIYLLKITRRVKTEKRKTYKRYARSDLTTNKKTLNLLIKQYELYASQGRIREWREFLKKVMDLTDAEVLEIENQIKKTATLQGLFLNMVCRSSVYMDTWLKISYETKLNREDITESVLDAIIENALDILALKNTNPGFMSCFADVYIEMYAIENYGYNKMMAYKGSYKQEIPLTKGKLDPVI